VAIALCAAACGPAAGCLLRSPSLENRTLRVTYLPNHTVDVRGAAVTLDGLPAHLKAAGAVPSTTIRVAIPGDLPKERKEHIIRILAAAGLPHVFLVGPRRAAAYVGTPPPATK
jgi:hypothetical protein